MGLKEHLLIVFIVMGRFFIDIYDPIISSDIMALVLILILVVKFPKSVIAKISMLITLSVLYSDILRQTNINTDLSILASIGAIITLLIAFTPRYGYTN